MMEVLAPLEAELAAYSPLELAELSETVGILLDVANDGTGSYLDARVRIGAALEHAVERRLEIERHASRTATIIPLRWRE